MMQIARRAGRNDVMANHDIVTFAFHAIPGRDFTQTCGYRECPLH
jgi:hypothetical protein